MTDREQRLLAGEVGKPHGINGEVYVLPISDDPGRFESGSQLIHEDGRRLVIESVRPHRARLLVKFEDHDSRSAAEGLRGALFIESDEIRALDENEFWEHELIGMRVVGTDGQPFGTVARVLGGRAQDLIEIDTARGPRMVPLVKPIVVRVHEAEGKIVIDPPQGLLD